MADLADEDHLDCTALNVEQGFNDSFALYILALHLTTLHVCMMLTNL